MGARADTQSPGRQARLDDRLLDLFPPHKRTLADLESHFMVPRPTFLHSRVGYRIQVFWLGFLL